MLITKYGNNFTVFPGSTLIHYLSGTNNPIGIDWVLNAEVSNQYEKLLVNKDPRNFSFCFKEIRI